jgi:hypothetical protein
VPVSGLIETVTLARNRERLSRSHGRRSEKTEDRGTRRDRVYRELLA